MFNLEIKIIATVMGYSRPNVWDERKKEYVTNNDEFQIQTLVTLDSGEIVKKTLRVKKALDDKEIEKMIDKTFEFSGVEEYEHKNGNFTTYTYSATEFKQIENKSGPIFRVDKIVTMKIDNVIEKNGAVIAQMIIKDGMRVDVKSIKFTEARKEDVEKFKGKNVKVFVRVAKLNGKYFYTSRDLPIPA